jgi:type III pantothenate kinase
LICYDGICSAKIPIMLLAIDIGNTTITLGLMVEDSWRNQWRLRTVHDMTVDEYGVYLKSLLGDNNSQLHGAIMSSVVPPLTGTFVAVCQDYLSVDPMIVTPESKTGIIVATENPVEVGADRIVNAAAAYSLYPGSSIVVDMGTATTFDVISSEGHLVGVAIAPGLGLAASALSGRAAQLGDVALEAPPSAIGRNTVHAMQSGLIYGYVAMIEGMIKRMAGEMGWSDFQVIGTGGLISAVAPHTNAIQHIEPWLTLTGLRLIYDLNSEA